MNNNINDISFSFKKIWLVKTNSDRKFGRGKDIIIAYSSSKEEALKIAKGEGPGGEDAIIFSKELPEISYYDGDGNNFTFIITQWHDIENNKKILSSKEKVNKIRLKALKKLSNEERLSLGIL